MVKQLLERAKASLQIDDNAESITKHLRTFRDASKAIEDRLRKKGPFTTVNYLILYSSQIANIVFYYRSNVTARRKKSMIKSNQQYSQL